MENTIQSLPEIGVAQERGPLYGCVGPSDSGPPPGLFAEMLGQEQGRTDCQTLPGVAVPAGDAQTPAENDTGTPDSTESERIPETVLAPILVDPFGGMLAGAPPMQAGRASYAVVPREGSEEQSAGPQAVGTWRSGFLTSTAEYRIVAGAAQTGKSGEAAAAGALPNNAVGALGSVAVAETNVQPDIYMGAGRFIPESYPFEHALPAESETAPNNAAQAAPSGASQTPQGPKWPGWAEPSLPVAATGFATSGTAEVSVAPNLLLPRVGLAEAPVRTETPDMGENQPPDLAQPVAASQSTGKQPNGQGVIADSADAQDVLHPSGEPSKPALAEVPGTVQPNQGEAQRAENANEAAETDHRALWAEAAPKPHKATEPSATERMPAVQASKALGAFAAESEKSVENAVLTKFRSVEKQTAETDTRGTSAASVSGKQNGPIASDRANPAAIVAGHSREAQSKPVVELPARPTLETLGDHTVRSVRFLVAHGNSIVKVRLVPESLGEVRIQIETSDDGVQVRLASANPAVRETLVAQAEGLRRSLVSQGIEVANVTVSADISSNPGTGGFAYRQPQHYGEPPRGNAPFASYARGSEPAFHPDRRNPAHHDGLLNVLV